MGCQPLSEDGQWPEPCQSGASAGQSLIPFSPATGLQPEPRVTAVPRAANPHSWTSRLSTCSSAMQTIKEDSEKQVAAGAWTVLQRAHKARREYHTRHHIRHHDGMLCSVIVILNAIHHTILYVISHLYAISHAIPHKKSCTRNHNLHHLSNTISTT